MKVLLTGGTGMVGGHVLEYCLQNEKISEVVSFVRKASGQSHKKLTEVVLQDFEDYTSQAQHFENVDAAHFCIGVYTGQVPDDVFKKITVDYAVQFAKMLEANSPQAKYCLLSGQGADRKEKSRTSFARYKGMAENQIDAMDLAFHSFRPGYIYPVVPRKEPNMMYTVSRKLYPLLKVFGRNASIKSTELANAMVKVGLEGASKNILENRDIRDIFDAQ